tara:strand:+ start:346 stop:534 length:189 start_codon:yes stop_codon:yes gene_type:complete
MKLPKNFQKNISTAYILLGSILGLGIVGYILSYKYNNQMWLISFLLLGTVIGLYELYKRIKD